MRMHRLLSVCSMAVVFALGTVSPTLAKTFSLGTLTPTDPLSKSVIAPSGAILDNLTFNFTVANGPLDVYADLVNGYTQDQNHNLATGLLSSGNLNSYIELFSGDPAGVHTAVAGSFQELIFNPLSGTVTGTTQTFRLTPGQYFLELVATAPGKAGPPPLTMGGADFTVGVFGSPVSDPPVPEPATWGMLILGAAMIGIAARRRSGAIGALALAS